MRIKALLNYRKQAFWVSLTSVVVCAVIVLCFLTDPIGRSTASDDPAVSDVYENSDSALELQGEDRNPAFDPAGNTGSISYTAVGADETETYLPSKSIIGEQTLSDDFAGEAQDTTEHYYFPKADNPIGLSMIATAVSPTGCTLMLSQAGGAVTGELITGEFFEIQGLGKNGEWEKTFATLEWEDVAHLIKNGGVTELPLEWESIYGALPDGHYRVMKRAMDIREPGDYDEYEVYAEFDIGE